MQSRNNSELRDLESPLNVQQDDLYNQPPAGNVPAAPPQRQNCQGGVAAPIATYGNDADLINVPQSNGFQAKCKMARDQLIGHAQQVNCPPPLQPDQALFPGEDVVATMPLIGMTIRPLAFDGTANSHLPDTIPPGIQATMYLTNNRLLVYDHWAQLQPTLMGCTPYENVTLGVNQTTTLSYYSLPLATVFGVSCGASRGTSSTVQASLGHRAWLRFLGLGFGFLIVAGAAIAFITHSITSLPVAVIIGVVGIALAVFAELLYRMYRPFTISPAVSGTVEQRDLWVSALDPLTLRPVLIRFQLRPNYLSGPSSTHEVLLKFVQEVSVRCPRILKGEAPSISPLTTF